jgi:NADH-quinone oxidoreductase subunit L
MAYSTVSQLGYMFMALGAAAAGPEAATLAVTAAMFHLFTHAFFKALLFLSSGSVMHSMGDVIDMRRFGGLRRVLPTTHRAFLCGAAALAGVPLLSGFWSKDAIFASLYTASHMSEHGAFYGWVLAIAALTAFLTAFYTFRAYFLTFWGAERFPPEAGHHPHEVPPVMAWPLRILAVFALFIGMAVGPTGWFGNYLYHASGLGEVAEEGFVIGLVILSVAVVLGGIVLAWFMYIGKPELPSRVASAFGPLYNLSLNKFYIDEIYTALIVTPLHGLAGLSNWFDQNIIDPIVDFIALVPRALSGVPLWMHNGLVPSYAMIMWLGLLACVLFAMRMLPL